MGENCYMFAVSMAFSQIKAGKYFLFEHPASASSWKDPWMERLARAPGVIKVTADQCMYGLTATAPGGEVNPARKPTTFLTNSFSMAQQLSARCDGSHSHTPLHGKQLEAAAFYPVKLRLAILRGMRDTADMEWIKSQDADDQQLKSATSLAGSLHSMPIFHLAATM